MVLPSVLVALLPGLAAPAPFQEAAPAPREPAPRIDDRYAPGAVAAWVIEQAGTRLGHCRSRYAGEVRLGALRAHRFEEQVLLEIPGPAKSIVQRFTMELLVDARGRPLRFDFRSQTGEVAIGVEGGFADGQAELFIRQGASRRPTRLEVPADVHLLANNFLSQIELLLALDPPRESRGEWTLLSVNALRTFPYTVAPASREGWLQDSLGELLRMEDGRLTRVEIPSQEIVIRRVEEDFEPFALEIPRLARPEDQVHEEVAIDDGDVHLEGTLSRPKKASGRLPALFFLSGSGLQDRDGFSQGIDVGTHQILDALGSAGFVVLRMDDRGTGGSTGPLDELAFDDLVEDGRRALRFLRARPEVDPARIGLLGHSEGGLSGPLLAREGGVAALVLLAAPARSVEVLLGEQLRLQRSREGAPPEEVEAIGTALRDFLAALRRGDPVRAEDLAPELAAFLPARAWLVSHLDRDPLAVLREVPCPVLVLQGGRDLQVSAERDAPLLLRALEDAGHADHALRVFPDLDHFFMHPSEDPSTDLLSSRPIDPEFLDTLRRWLVAHLDP